MFERDDDRSRGFEKGTKGDVERRGFPIEPDRFPVQASTTAPSPPELSRRRVRNVFRPGGGGVELSHG